MPPFVDLTGQTFNRLTVIERVENSKPIRWKCICDCGNTTIVETGPIKSGHTKSCGCLHIEICRELGFRSSTHCMTNTPEYKSWECIKQRCNNPNDHSFNNYGGRGIVLCDKWQNDFVAFYKHVGPRPSIFHSIERINNNSNYEPGNVKWASAQEQANNTRRNHVIIIHGWSLNVTQWAKFVGLGNTTLLQRINAYGWPIAKAIFTPVQYHKSYIKNSNPR